MYDVWFYIRDEHSTDKITVNTMDELYDWFMQNGGYDCSVIITNICEHHEYDEEES